MEFTIELIKTRVRHTVVNIARHRPCYLCFMFFCWMAAQVAWTGLNMTVSRFILIWILDQFGIQFTGIIP